MSDPTERNRLDGAASPYLRQHSDNPVNWQPWDERALAAARERDVPIFLSVGYSACHWCHVMEEESFEDEGVAEVLNESFVPVKVDREERPDLDSIYQTVCQAVSGRGGWPLSAWLTPEGKPFYVGTYFPRESRRGMPSFLDLLERISDSWSDPEDREEMERRADQWTAAARDELESTPGAGSAGAGGSGDSGSVGSPGTVGEDPDSVLLDAADAALRAADREYGGFGSGGPKFPHPGRIHLLLRSGDRTGRDAYRDVAVETLDAMASGGMYDHVGGGFHRYATDRDWTVPHFEKMLYDNAELPRAYLAGYRVTGRERYADIARETFDFLDRELRHPDGGFYSTLDARSIPPASRDPDGSDTEADPDPEEGAFYTWTPDEVQAAIEDSTDADLFASRYGVTAGGNFEGTTVLTLPESIENLAGEFDLSAGEVESRLDRARDQALAARENRPRPRRDEKVLAGWNGLAVSALAEAGWVLDREYADSGARALEFVRDHLWDPDAGRLDRRFKDGDVLGPGYLEDYAYLGRGALDLFGVTRDPDHLAFALDLADALVEEFYDPDQGTLYFTPESGEDLVTRPQDPRDQSTPSSLAVGVDLLLSADEFRPGDDFREVAHEVLGTNAPRARSRPMEHVGLAMAADRHARGPLELTIAADDPPEEWYDRLGETYLPGAVIAPRPESEEKLEGWLGRLELDDPGPIWADRGGRGGPTLYVCRSFTCSPPLRDVAEAVEWVGDLAPEVDRGGEGSSEEDPRDWP